MTMKTIVQGTAKGIILKSNNPINFLGAVDKKTGIIRDQSHDLFQKSIRDVVLVFPHGIGSSVGAYTIYSLKTNDSAPLAMSCTKADLSVAVKPVLPLETLLLWAFGSSWFVKGETLCKDVQAGS